MCAMSAFPRHRPGRRASPPSPPRGRHHLSPSAEGLRDHRCCRVYPHFPSEEREVQQVGKQSARPGPLTCTPAWQGEGRVAACPHLPQLLPEAGKSGKGAHPMAAPRPPPPWSSSQRQLVQQQPPRPAWGGRAPWSPVGLSSLGRRKECASAIVCCDVGREQPRCQGPRGCRGSFSPSDVATLLS